MESTFSCICWHEKGYIQALHRRICCWGFQLLSGISFQPRIKHFASLRRTVMAPHHGHQFILRLAQAAPSPAKLYHGPCFKVPRALSALCLFLQHTHPHPHSSLCAGRKGGVSISYSPMPSPSSPSQLSPLINVK